MGNETLNLWFAYPEDVRTEAVFDVCESMLSVDEHARLQRLRSDSLRREFLATRYLVHTALTDALSPPPESLCFSQNAYGKPALNPDCGLRFNLSNCTGLVTCLVSHRLEVGVDIEPHERADKILEIASDVFSELELAQLDGAQASEKLDRALSLWTLKEAYIKARGLGLSLPLKSFSFHFDPEQRISMQLDSSLGDDAGRWRFCLMDHAGHRVALVVEAIAHPALQLWEARPVSVTPLRLAPGEYVWYPILPSL